MKSLVNRLGVAGLLVGGIAALSGCAETSCETVLDEMSVEGHVKIRLVRDIETAAQDDYRLEVYNNEGKKIVNFTSENSLNDDTLVIHPDGRVYGVVNGKPGFQFPERIGGAGSGSSEVKKVDYKSLIPVGYEGKVPESRAEQ